MGKKAVIDWSKVASQSFPVYAAGTYRVRIEDWEETEAKNTKTPQVLWTSTIIEGPDTGGPMRDYTPLTEKSLFRIANLVQACNVDLSNLSAMEVGSKSFAKVLDACKGCTTYWTVSYDKDYNNNKVTNYSVDASQQPVMVAGEEEPPF